MAFLQSRHLNELLLVKNSVGRQVYQKAKSVFKKRSHGKISRFYYAFPKENLSELGIAGAIQDIQNIFSSFTHRLLL